MKYQILVRYPNSDNKDKWSIWDNMDTFNCKKDARNYADKTIKRYSNFDLKYHLDMKVISIDDDKAKTHDVLLNTVLD